MTTPSSGFSPGQCVSTASAIAAAALPAPTTTVRPRGGAGRCFGTICNGSAAASAAWKLPRSSSRGFKTGFPSPRGRRLYASSGRGFLPRRRLQDRLEKLPGEALFGPGHVLGRALRDHLPAAIPALGTHVHDPVGGLD